MHTLSRKVLTLAGLVAFSVPAFASTPTFPLGLGNGKAAVERAETSNPQLGSFVGQYSFLIQGAIVAPNFVSRRTSAAGSLIADGNGHVTGVFDSEGPTGVITKAPLTGTYTLDATGVGTLTVMAGGATFKFSLFTPAIPGKVQNATLVESDSIAGSIGYLNKQVVPASLDGSYNFNLAGETFETTGVANAISVGGTFAISQGSLQGAATIFVGDAAEGSAVVVTGVAFPATMTAIDANGRFTLTAVFPGGPQIHFIGYALDATHFSLIPGDPASETSVLISGSAVR